jgi:hypothetical protein
MRSRTVPLARRFASLFVVLAVTVTACTVTTSSSPTTDPTTPATTGGETGNRPQNILASNALVVFDACDTFLDYVISHAVDIVGPYGLDDPTIYPWFGNELRALDDAAVSAEAGGSDGSAPSYSSTNVQVAGVDEPDIVKTDGKGPHVRITVVHVPTARGKRCRIRSGLPDTNHPDHRSRHQ